MRWLPAVVLVTLLGGCSSSGSAHPPSTPHVAPSTSSATSAATTQLLGVRKTSAGSVLVTAAGRTLYYSSLDTPTAAKCTGDCTAEWMPLLGPPVAGAVITGVLSTLALPGGYEQAEYSGHPLYTYAGDKAPGDVRGNGRLGSWHVASVN